MLIVVSKLCKIFMLVYIHSAVDRVKFWSGFGVSRDNIDYSVLLYPIINSIYYILTIN